MPDIAQMYYIEILWQLANRNAITFFYCLLNKKTVIGH